MSLSDKDPGYNRGAEKIQTEAFSSTDPRSSDYFLGKRYYFVGYDARIHVMKDALVRSAQMTIVGNHLYTMLLPHVPKVVTDPGVNWQTFDGVSIRPRAFSER